MSELRRESLKLANNLNAVRSQLISIIRDTAVGVCDIREKVKECLFERMKYSRNFQITLTEMMLHKYMFF